MTRTSHRSLPVLLFALVWLSVAWFGSWAWNPNTAVRMFAAAAIVEEHQPTIDRFAHLTIDRAQFGGRFYMDKAPGMTLMALPAVAIANVMEDTTSVGMAMDVSDPALDRYMRLRVWLAAAMINATLLAFASAAMFDIGRRTSGSPSAAMFGALGFALGTPLWGWSTTLFGHAPVASLLVIAIWLVMRGTLRGRETSGRYPLLAGLTLGWALVIEHSALLFALPIGLWALWWMHTLRPPVARRAIVEAVIGGVLAAVPLLGYNLFAFGDPFRLGYQGVVGFDGMKQGLFGLTRPSSAALVEILVGARRGMLWVAPILVIAPFGLARLWRRGERSLVALAVSGAVIAFLYNASYVYWDGGNSTGPRHAMPAIAFLALGFAPLWAAATPIARVPLAALLAASMTINCTIAAAEITAPQDIPNALVDAVWQGRFVPGYLRTIPNEWLGYTAWQGLGMYLGLAALLMTALAIVARQARLPNI